MGNSCSSSAETAPDEQQRPTSTSSTRPTTPVGDGTMSCNSTTQSGERAPLSSHHPLQPPPSQRPPGPTRPPKQRKVYHSIVPTPDEGSNIVDDSDRGTRCGGGGVSPPHLLREELLSIAMSSNTSPNMCTTRNDPLRSPTSVRGGSSVFHNVVVKSDNLSQDSDILRVESVSESYGSVAGASPMLHGNTGPAASYPENANDNLQDSFGRPSVNASGQGSPNHHPQLCSLPGAICHSMGAQPVRLMSPPQILPSSRHKTGCVSPQSSSYSPATSEFNWGGQHQSHSRPTVSSPVIDANVTNDTISNTFLPDGEGEDAPLHHMATAEWRSTDPTPTSTPPLMSIKHVTAANDQPTAMNKGVVDDIHKVWSASSQGGELDEAALLAYMKAGRDAFGTSTSIQSEDGGSRPSPRLSVTTTVVSGASGQSPLHSPHKRSQKTSTSGVPMTTTSTIAGGAIPIDVASLSATTHVM